MSSRQKLGKTGEDLAAAALTQRGDTIVARNWRCSYGELDLITHCGDTLVVAEVRTRRSQAFGTPEESLTATKQARLAAAAHTYVQTTGWAGPWRIDLVAIVIDQRGRVARLTVLENVVGG